MSQVLRSNSDVNLYLVDPQDTPRHRCYFECVDEQEPEDSPPQHVRCIRPTPSSLTVSFRATHSTPVCTYTIVCKQVDNHGKLNGKEAAVVFDITNETRPQREIRGLEPGTQYMVQVRMKPKSRPVLESQHFGPFETARVEAVAQRVRKSWCLPSTNNVSLLKTKLRKLGEWMDPSPKMKANINPKAQTIKVHRIVDASEANNFKSLVERAVIIMVLGESAATRRAFLNALVAFHFRNQPEERDRILLVDDQHPQQDTRAICHVYQVDPMEGSELESSSVALRPMLLMDVPNSGTNGKQERRTDAVYNDAFEFFQYDKEEPAVTRRGIVYCGHKANMTKTVEKMAKVFRDKQLYFACEHFEVPPTFPTSALDEAARQWHHFSIHCYKLLDSMQAHSC